MVGLPTESQQLQQMVDFIENSIVSLGHLGVVHGEKEAKPPPMRTTKTQSRRKNLRNRKGLFGIAIALALVGFAMLGSSVFPARAAASSRTTLVGSAPSWANSKNYVSTADPNASIGFRLYLGWNNPSAVEALAKSVSDPHSSAYGQYLTPAQFRQQFAPSQSQVGAVQSWLRSQGFNVEYTPQNNHYVSAEGTVAQAQAAFGTGFGNYLVQGQTLRSPTADISVPSSFASIVTSVVALDESFQFVQTYHKVDGNAPPSAGFRNSPPLSTFWAKLLSPYAFPAGFTDLALTSAPWS